MSTLCNLPVPVECILTVLFPFRCTMRTNLETGVCHTSHWITTTFVENIQKFWGHFTQKIKQHWISTDGRQFGTICQSILLTFMPWFVNAFHDLDNKIRSLYHISIPGISRIMITTREWRLIGNVKNDPKIYERELGAILDACVFHPPPHQHHSWV